MKNQIVIDKVEFLFMYKHLMQHMTYIFLWISLPFLLIFVSIVLIYGIFILCADDNAQLCLVSSCYFKWIITYWSCSFSVMCLWMSASAFSSCAFGFLNILLYSFISSLNLAFVSYSCWISSSFLSNSGYLLQPSIASAIMFTLAMCSSLNMF